MSKLADAMRRNQRVEATPMGFGAARLAAKPSLLVGFLAPPSAVAAACEAGADLIIVEGEIAPAEAAMLRAAAGDLPLGVSPRSPDAATAKALREAGIDFIIFDADTTPASALLEEELGYVLRLPEAPAEPFLRSLDTLSLEALGLRPLPAPLTAAVQIELGRVAALGRKPLLCPVDAAVSKEDLQCLRAAGVVVVVIAGALQDVRRLKEMVASLPPRRARREERPVVALPRGQVPAEEEEEDDDHRAP